MSAAAVIFRRRRKLIRRFREAGATSPGRAVSLEGLGVRRSWIFNQMERYGVFCQTKDGRYFLNQAAGEAFVRARKLRALVIFGVFLIVYLISLLFWSLAR